MANGFKGLVGVTSVVAVAGMATGLTVAAQAHEGPLFTSVAQVAAGTPNADTTAPPVTEAQRPIIYVTESPKAPKTVYVNGGSSGGSSNGSSSGSSSNSGSTTQAPPANTTTGSS